MKKNRWMVSALAFALLGGMMLSSCKPSDAQMEQALKSYLDKNPQFMQKRVEEYFQKKQGQRAPEVPLEELIKNPIQVDLNNAPTLGPATAPITIVEFSDFQCPFCKRVIPTVKELLKKYDGKVRLAFRQHPLPMHQHSMSAAKASLAANAQGKFWALHDALFENQQDLSDEGILKIARKVGLNMSRFKNDWKSTKFDAQIQADGDFAQKSGASGTPAFFINGVPFKGARPLESFSQLIDKLLEQKGAKPQQAAPETAPAATQPTKG